MNAATGQKLGHANVNPGVQGGLNVFSSAIQGSGVLGVGMNNNNDQSKGLMNFNIQGTNGKLKRI